MDYTGTDDNIFQNYKVYPNPAHNYVSIDMAREQTNVSINVFDMKGKLLKIKELDRFTLTDLDINELEAGLYMIQIQSDQVNTVARLIKE